MSFIFIIFSTLLSAVFGLLRYKYSYWELQGVQQLKTHFLFGNFFSIKSISLKELIHDVYVEFKGKAKIAGAYVFTKPIAVVLDLELAKAILIKDFNKFVNRSDYDNEENDPISAHLFNLPGDKWRHMRTKLTPTFTSGKMKYMFPTIVSVAKELEQHFQRHVDSDNAIELHDIMARFTTDVIGNCVFGIDCNSLKDPDVEFRAQGRRIMMLNMNYKLKLFLHTYSKYTKLLGFKVFGAQTKEFFMRVVRETVALREEQKIKRNDFMDLLIELRNASSESGQGLTIEQLAAQAFLFFIAGFETSSSNMSYCLFELSKNSAIQEKLRAEITSVLEKYDGVLSYEAMMDMPYLDQVINETLRKYPALAGLTRVAMEDYAVHGTDITLERGTRVYIPAKEIHYDPDIYDNPQEFRPERFAPEEVQKRHPQAFLGFGDGPRNCIGLRFGRMQVRVGLITLLRSFKFGLAAQSPKELEITKKSLILMPANGVWLRAEKL